MLGAMKQFIWDLHLLRPGSTVLCAVSGGADSVCLLHSLYHLRPKFGFHLTAAHYNHMLRGEESDRDALFVEQFTALCCGPQRLADGSILPAVPLFSGCGDVGAEAKRLGIGLEEAARSMRYAFLRQAAEKAGAGCIATAHTADDNVETILFHLARGAGLRGMTGIPPVRDDLIRPLLTTTRREIEAYLTYYGLPHREDHTNSDDAYARNRIRHQVVPVLEELCPGFAARVAGTAARLRSDEECLSVQARAISQQAVFQGADLSISAALIGAAPDSLAVRAVRELIGRLNGGDQNCAAAHLDAVVRLCRGSAPSAQTHLPYGMTARREYQQLIFTRDAATPLLSETPMSLPGEIDVGCWHVVCSAQPYSGQPQGPYEFWLDQARVGALTLRTRRTGDRLKLPGRPEKTVKKWCIDEKVPARLRPVLPVLEWGGQVAAVAGLGPAEAFLPRIGTGAWHITINTRSI